MYYFYILRCSDNTLYCGQTNNLEKRLKEHNSAGPRSAKYLRGKLPVKLVYSEEFETVGDALRREIEVKGWTKERKEKIISVPVQPARLRRHKFETGSGGRRL